MSPGFPSHRRSAGFTLVEMLTAMVILALILLAVASVTAFVSRTWSGGLASTDNDTKARSILGLLDRDIQMIILRRDVAAFVDGSGNPACAFYTNVQGYPGSDTRSVSLVRYVLSSTPTASVLQRLEYGMNFMPSSAGGVSPVVGNPLPSNLSQFSTLSSSIQTENLSPGVILFEWQFVAASGAITTPNAPGSPAFKFDFTSYSAPGNPRIAVVSMLVLSNSAYQLATGNGTTLAAIQALFPSSGLGVNQTYAAYWNSILNPATGTFGASLPAPVRQGLQVFERHIPLPIVTPSA